VASVAAALAGRLSAVSADVRGVIEQEIAALRDNQRIATMLDASVTENITTILHALRHGIDTAAIEAPTSAIEYSRRLAQRGVAAEELLRAYRLGQARFTRLFVEELMCQTGGERMDGSTTLLAFEQISQYIDRVVGRVLVVYDHERASSTLSAGRRPHDRANCSPSSMSTASMCLGVSFGGGLAQQLAHQAPKVVRRLVLAATSTGSISVPPSPRTLLVLASPRRYYDRNYYRRVAARQGTSHQRRRHRRGASPSST